jgi:cysteinyl-tRNA synthetase
LLDDINTPGFIAKIHELYNKSQKGDDKSKKLFNSACRLLGLFNLNKQEWNNFKKNKTSISENFIEQKINERLEAKKNGNYDLADKIRKELYDNGVIIEDQKDLTNWKYK